MTTKAPIPFLLPRDPLERAFTPVLSHVLAELQSPNSRKDYHSQAVKFFQWHQAHWPALALPTRDSVLEYKSAMEARGLAPGSINCALAVIAGLVREAAAMKLITYEQAGPILAIKRLKSRGVRQGVWLGEEQAKAVILTAAAPGTLLALRNAAIIAVSIGCGLRRHEAARLRVEQIRQVLGHWHVIDLVGKGNRTRTPGMPVWAYAAVQGWLQAAGITEGLVFRQVSKHGKIASWGERAFISGTLVANVVKEASAAAGFPIAAHDARRTYAKLAKDGGADLHQLQLDLGHSSIATTERYLGTDKDFARPPCDSIGIRIDPDVFRLRSRGQERQPGGRKKPAPAGPAAPSRKKPGAERPRIALPVKKGRR